jgi:hypothetical protein
MRNTADLTGGKPIAVWLPSISSRGAVNPLVAFYDIHGRKREGLFFCSVPDTTRDSNKTGNNFINICFSAPFVILNKGYKTSRLFALYSSDYTLWTFYHSYFKGISANIALQVYSVTCCWQYNPECLFHTGIKASRIFFMYTYTKNLMRTLLKILRYLRS